MKKDIKDEELEEETSKPKIQKTNLYDLVRKTNLYLIPNPNRSIGKWLHKTNSTKRPPKARAKGR